MRLAGGDVNVSTFNGAKIDIFVEGTVWVGLLNSGCNVDVDECDGILGTVDTFSEVEAAIDGDRDDGGGEEERDRGDRVDEKDDGSTAFCPYECVSRGINGGLWCGLPLNTLAKLVSSTLDE
jgi:hypothetical protein